jgi:hypothetical protein
LTESLDRLEVQVEVSERQYEASATSPVSPELIDWESRSQETSDTREKIDEYFDAQ